MLGEGRLLSLTKQKPLNNENTLHSIKAVQGFRFHKGEAALLFRTVVLFYVLSAHYLTLYLDLSDNFEHRFLINPVIYDKNAISLDLYLLTAAFCRFDLLLFQTVHAKKPLIRALSMGLCFCVDNSVNCIAMLLQTFP